MKRRLLVGTALFFASCVLLLILVWIVNPIKVEPLFHKTPIEIVLISGIVLIFSFVLGGGAAISLFAATADSRDK